MGKPKRRIKQKRRSVIWNDVVILVFAFISIILLALELRGDLSAAQTRTLHAFDLAVAIIFLLEFISRLVKQKNKRRFLLFHWWELLAAIPITNTVTQALRGLRLISVFELVSVIRAGSRLEVTGEIMSGLTDHPYVIETLSSILALLFTSSVVFFAAERGHNPHVHSLWDAFWWATTTMTTTGYGDIYPLTTAGRILAMILMLTGVATMALLTSVLLKYMLTRKRST